jgi:hypothetical protein
VNLEPAGFFIFAKFLLDDIYICKFLLEIEGGIQWRNLAILHRRHLVNRL